MVYLIEIIFPNTCQFGFRPQSSTQEAILSATKWLAPPSQLQKRSCLCAFWSFKGVWYTSLWEWVFLDCYWNGSLATFLTASRGLFVWFWFLPNQGCFWCSSGCHLMSPTHLIVRGPSNSCPPNCQLSSHLVCWRYPIVQTSHKSSRSLWSSVWY